jgi:glycosyltransferase involved in cell wall biosynthesis
MATIDVLLPVKNCHAYLGEAIDSVCKQSFRDWRLLVLDHGSTDGSVELAHSYAARDKRVKVLNFPDAHGLSGLLNEGLAQCDCRYMMRHDADDICLPNRMELSLRAIKATPGKVVISGQAELINGAGDTIGALRLPAGSDRVTAASFFRNPVLHPAVMMDFPASAQLGARYGIDFLRVLPAEHSLAVDGLAEDYFMYSQLAMLGKCINIPDRLIRYRWHASNVSVLRFEEQMRVSLRISRFMAFSFCSLHSVPHFDPAPFCNHGGKVFDMGERRDFEDEFADMESTLQLVLGPSDELSRELSYRYVLATRNLRRMLLRYGLFNTCHRPETGEWYAVKSWLLRHLPGRGCLRAGTERMA